MPPTNAYQTQILTFGLHSVLQVFVTNMYCYSFDHIENFDKISTFLQEFIMYWVQLSAESWVCKRYVGSLSDAIVAEKLTSRHSLCWRLHVQVASDALFYWHNNNAINSVAAAAAVITVVKAMDSQPRFYLCWDLYKSLVASGMELATLPVIALMLRKIVPFLGIRYTCLEHSNQGSAQC